MSGRQLIVHRTLMDKGETIGILYECALRILFDISNPGRLMLAAHSIREMMGQLPKVLDLPILADAGRLGDQVNALEPVWSRATKSRCNNGGKWAGEIDRPLQKLLGTLHEFFQWVKDHHPKRRDVVSRLFRSTDPSGLPLPQKLETQRVERWLAIHNYFVNVTHRSPSDESVFRSSLEELEQILLDSLYRRPSEDFFAIDDILSEEESND